MTAPAASPRSSRPMCKGPLLKYGHHRAGKNGNATFPRSLAIPRYCLAPMPVIRAHRIARAGSTMRPLDLRKITFGPTTAVRQLPLRDAER